MTNLFISGVRIEKDPTAQPVYPFTLPVVRHLGSLKLNKNVTFFIGENGIGKSTLLEAIAVNYGFNPEGGSKNFDFATNTTHSVLHEHMILTKGVKLPDDGFFLRAESFYNVATEVENIEKDGAGILSAYGGKSLHEQSHGESFMALLQNRFRGKGLYILDEPEAALSPFRQIAVLSVIDDLVKSGSQFIIATHSPILLAYPDSEIYVLAETGITLTAYKETEHYLLTKCFLDNPERMLSHLYE